MTLQSNEDIAAREYVKASGFRNAGQDLTESNYGENKTVRLQS